MQKSIQSIKRKNNVFSLLFKKLVCLNAKYCNVKARPRHEKTHLKHKLCGVLFNMLLMMCDVSDTVCKKTEGKLIVFCLQFLFLILTVMAGPAKARLSSIRRGMTSWLGSM